MRKPVVLKGPGATPEDVAKALGVTPKRQAEIKEIIAELRSKHKVTATKSSKKKVAVRKIADCHA